MKSQGRSKTLLKVTALCLGLIHLTGCADLNPMALGESDFNSIESMITVSPANQTIGAGETLQFRGYGGDAPYSYSVVGGGSISVNGLYTAPPTVTGAYQIVTIYAMDSIGETGSTTLTIQPGSSLIAVSYSPNPAPINTVITLTPSGGEAPYTYSLVSGMGSLNGNKYTTSLSGEAAIVRVTDRLGRSTQVTIAVSGPTNVITNLGMTKLGTHAVGGGGCAAGFGYLGSVADGGGSSFYGDQIFCGQPAVPTVGVPVLSGIVVTASGAGCPNNYTEIGQVRGSGTHRICVIYRYPDVPGQTVSDFYVTQQGLRNASGPACASGYTRVGTVADCAFGQCSGLQSFCAAIQQ